MFTISPNGEIGLTRGDTARLTITITNEAADGGAYEIQATDVLTLSLKKSVNDAEYAFQKRVEGTNAFKIEPQDTSELAFGKYRYDVQLTTVEGDVYTVIPPTVFEIMQEVTN